MINKGVLNAIERRFPWSFLGFLAGMTFGIFGIYTVFFYAKAPDLRLEILSSAPVLSIRENVQDLEILFKGQNIRETRQALTLINLKLINRGNVPVKPGDFDQKDLLQLCVSDGELVKSDILETSEPYLDKVFAETTTTKEDVAFPPFIMEPGHFISLRLLVLHSESVKPTLNLKGKVANVTKIPVVQSSESIMTPTKGSTAFSGDVVVQFIRIASYGLGTLGFLVGAIFLFLAVREKMENKQRLQRMLSTKTRIRPFLESLNMRDRRRIEPIADALLSPGEDILLLSHSELSMLFSQSPEKIRNDPNILYFMEGIRMRVPNFDSEYFLSNDDALNKLRKLVMTILNI